MVIRLLGPLEIRGQDDQWQRIEAPKCRLLLALLAISAGHPVPLDRIADRLWPDGPPRSATNQIHGYVSRLRALLDDSGSKQVLITRSPGYELAAVEHLDAVRFESLAAEGSAALDRGDLETADASLREALSLWRGPAFADVTDCPEVLTEADRLNEQRLTAWEARIEVDLRLGRHDQLVPELRQLVEQHQFRERFWSQLILALHQTGRQTDALATYRQLYELLDQEAGVAPSNAVRQLHQRILDNDPALTRSHEKPPLKQSPAAPRQLLALPTGFTGRARELSILDNLLDSTDAPGIAAISGLGGTGKTALSAYWAHQTADRFPDGQLYVDLRGNGPHSPVTPRDALGRLLRALGADPARVPQDVDEAAAAYRSLVADRRILIILDDARDTEHVRPLLPGTGPAVLLVISRRRLTSLMALHSATAVPLGRLDVAEGLALLEELLGADRVNAEQSAAARLVDLCDGLPLAIRISAADLVQHPERLFTELTATLDPADRLTSMELDDDPRANVRLALDHSHSLLSPDARRLLRLLALTPCPDLPDDAIIALSGLGAAAGARVLRQLADSHLVERRKPGRYTLHDLVKVHALEHGPAEPDEDLGIERLIAWYLATTARAIAEYLPDGVRVVEKIEAIAPVPDLTDPVAARSWLEAERLNLSAVVRTAAERGSARAAWQLCDLLRGFYFLHRHPEDWIEVGHLGLAAARADDHLAGQAGAELCLAQAYRSMTAYDAARTHQQAAVELAGRSGWKLGESMALNEVAVLHFEQGRIDDGVASLERAIVIDEETGHRELLSRHLMNLGLACLHAGKLDEAASRLRYVVTLTAPSAGMRALAQSSLGLALWLLGHPVPAQVQLDEALALQREQGHDAGLLMTHGQLGNVLCDLGQYADALTHVEQALAIADRIRSTRLRGGILALQARIEHYAGRPDVALRTAEEAEQLARSGENNLELADALLVRADIHLELNDLDQATSASTEALALADGHQYPIEAGRAHALLADVHLASGNKEAAQHSAAAAERHRKRTGYRADQARRQSA
ncbi:BTAD domain-containing putative transcriptional regulator [Kribbella sp. DT2]|uniref:AfsR/SARP family transcriptional regulator n=1 Tax=Kribbella sp. DT2 TaxID=3393427 RepID=UPI003CF1229A